MDILGKGKGGEWELKPEDCPNLDECYKIKMVLDKDLPDSQCAEAIRAVCANCSEVKGRVIELKTRIFDLSNGRYTNLSGLARAMGISTSQIYRVRRGERAVNQKFIIGAMRAFPGYKLEDLFYVAPGGTQ